jgi:hypothetical protein
MPVDANQPRLVAALQRWFEAEPPLRQTDWRVARQTNKGHGRLEQRTLIASVELNAYCQRDLGWSTVQQVLCLDRAIIHLRRGQQTHQRVYAITSLSPHQADAQTLLRYWRDHWGIENRLHWPRDVVMGEDACRVRRGSAAHALTALRNAALSLMRAFGFASLTAAIAHCRAHLHHTINFVCGSLE